MFKTFHGAPADKETHAHAHEKPVVILVP